MPPFSGYDETSVAAEKLFAELQDASWHRRYRAHHRVMRAGERSRRGGFTSENAPAGSPFISLAWLAAAGGESEELKSLASRQTTTPVKRYSGVIQLGRRVKIAACSKSSRRSESSNSIGRSDWRVRSLGTFPS